MATPSRAARLVPVVNMAEETERKAAQRLGHVQQLDVAIHPTTQHIAIFAGICYQHDETYLTPQGNNTKRGIWMLHEVRNGTFDPMFVSLGFLKRRYS